MAKVVLQNEHIQTLTTIHETFSRLITTSLSDLLRTAVHVHVALVSQITYDKYIRSIMPHSTLAVISMAPLRGNALLEIAPAVTSPIITRLFGGDWEKRYITHNELTTIERLAMAEVISCLLANMREAWAPHVADLRPWLAQIFTNPQYAKIVPPADMVALVALKITAGEVEGKINICIPCHIIDPAIKHFDPDHFLDLIQCEHLQTIALILSYLEPAKGSPIIQALPDEVRTDIIRRIICMNHTNSEITRIAERILERHCAPCNNLNYSGGLGHAVKILNLVDRDCKEQIIEFLEDEDPELAEEIKKRM